MSRESRVKHLAGQLIPCRWDLMAVYTMVDTSEWDGECRKALEDVLQFNEVVDSLTLLFYGAGYTTDKTTVEKVVGYDQYIKRVRERLTVLGLDEALVHALRMAESGGF